MKRERLNAGCVLSNLQYAPRAKEMHIAKIEPSDSRPKLHHFSSTFVGEDQPEDAAPSSRKSVCTVIIADLEIVSCAESRNARIFPLRAHTAE